MNFLFPVFSVKSAAIIKMLGSIEMSGAFNGPIMSFCLITLWTGLCFKKTRIFYLNIHFDLMEHHPAREGGCCWWRSAAYWCGWTGAAIWILWNTWLQKNAFWGHCEERRSAQKQPLLQLVGWPGGDSPMWVCSWSATCFWDVFLLQNHKQDIAINKAVEDALK